MTLFCPSPDSNAPPLLLNDKQLAALREHADMAVQQALIQCERLQAARKPALSNSRFSRYHTEFNAHDELTTPGEKLPSMGVSQVFGQVRGSYNKLARCFASETREEYYNIQKKMFSFTADARVLHNAFTPSKRSPAVSEAIKWSAYELFPLQYEADARQYEASGEGVDARGTPYAYHVSVPEATTDSPAFFPRREAVRIAFVSVVITRPHDAQGGFSNVWLTMRNDFGISDVHRSMFKRFRLTLQTAHALLVTATTAPPWVLVRDSWVPEKPAAKCGLCVKAFSVLRSKHLCLVCGRAVCRKCAVPTDGLEDTSTARPRRHEHSARLCALCMDSLAEDKDGERGPGGDAEQSTPHYLRLSETPVLIPNWCVSFTEKWGTNKTSRRVQHAPQHADAVADKTATTTSHQEKPRASSDESHRHPSSKSSRPRHTLRRSNSTRHTTTFEDEEDAETSTAETGVVFAVDTSEMARVGESDLVLSGISKSLQEQAILLSQMRSQLAGAMRSGPTEVACVTSSVLY